ncbi:MAG: polysaccharide deacetylase family protein [Alphaproteobacteria bacterium]
MLDERRIVRVPETAPPILTVAIDTEEEFDWDADFDRASTGVSAIHDIWRIQEVFDSYGIVPTYICDYPIASQDDSVAVLRQFADDGRAVIGSHLHTWVSPPFDEPVNATNSYQGRLPADLERRKMTVLTETITERFGRSPTVHKAGRYGFGPNTGTILADLGYEVDLSPTPGFDLSADGGPDYSRFGTDAYWFGPGHAMLGLPTTGGYVGFLGGQGSWLHGWATSGWRRSAKLPGILSRLGALSRQRLSAEGFTAADNKALTMALVERGVRVLSYSLHSPSLKVGCTPYVRSEADRVRFIDECRAYFDYFFETLGGVTMSSLDLKQYLQTHGISES